MLWMSLCELSSMPAIDFLEFFFQRLSCLKYTGSNSNKKLALITYIVIFLPVSLDVLWYEDVMVLLYYFCVCTERA